jgi:hypothetical protein
VCPISSNESHAFVNRLPSRIITTRISNPDPRFGVDSSKLRPKRLTNLPSGTWWVAGCWSLAFSSMMRSAEQGRAARIRAAAVRFTTLV